MGPRHRHQVELVVLAITVIGLSRLLDGPLIWLVAALLLAAVWLGGRAVLFDGALRPAPVPLEATIIPPSPARACSSTSPSGSRRESSTGPVA